MQMVFAPHFAVGHHTRERPDPTRSLKEVPVNADDLGIGLLFDRVLDAVVVGSVVTGRIALWNRAAEKLFGYSASEAVGRSIEMLMPAPMARVHRAGLDKYRRSGHGPMIDAEGPIEMPAVSKGGEELRIELSLSALLSRAGERFALAIIRDVTHRKQLDMTNLEVIQARVAQSDLAAAVAERDELLEAIAACLQGEPGPGQIRALVDALDTMKRLEAGELRPFRQSAELVDVVLAACDAARARAAGRRLHTYVPATAPATCDLDWTSQVLDNVLDAALRHAPEGGRVVACLEVLSSHAVQLSVRAESCTERHAPDLGLQFSRVLMRHQGGGLSVTTSPSGSLQVTLSLPGSPQPPRRRPSRPRGSANALVASGRGLPQLNPVVAGNPPRRQDRSRLTETPIR